MNRRDRALAREAGRYVVMWFCGLLALCTLLFMGLLVLMTAPHGLLFLLRRGTLLPLILVFTVTCLCWLFLLLVTRSDDAEDDADDAADAAADAAAVADGDDAWDDGRARDDNDDRARDDNRARDDDRTGRTDGNRTNGNRTDGGRDAARTDGTNRAGTTARTDDRGTHPRTTRYDGVEDNV
ncbi:hypothetical protein [Streptomyces lycii]|uniref:Uncharacterized protein n=1 Tax=Streptomyces lycii TaxID=2654337 RepID=A0ABQ7FK28_9ACTN|nr:hypothetical protein [Streptomyces lycii]KAF4409329.1 hypothetical protein GCU69_09620 [Streptomyces lycii]